MTKKEKISSEGNAPFRIPAFSGSWKCVRKARTRLCAALICPSWLKTKDLGSPVVPEVEVSVATSEDFTRATRSSKAEGSVARTSRPRARSAAIVMRPGIATSEGGSPRSRRMRSGLNGREG